MSVAELLKKRISVRAFSDSPVTAQQVLDLLETARWSPSGGNLQPWKVVVVSGAERLAVERLAMQALSRNPGGEAGDHPIYPQGLAEPYRTRRYRIGEDLYELMGIPREDKAARLRAVARNYQLFGAPVGLFFVIDRSMGHGQWAHLGMFMQSLALVAEEQGLATCMQEAWAMVRDSLHQHFQLPDNELVYCGMALGYADRSAPVNGLRSERAPVEEFAVLRGFD
ncbi:nitroreductase [Metapseudomonas resinovorans]|uniref:Putative nitroreductase n=1 Tax=Metapseudomonas resinovorans NBRC 106553 TaxID=1245471 RepID=S6AF11_METRE|nr:nitroreductase [Pseudomonas resinovorans]BAN48422.1 putative nitroreductase [Pseudomonas resinovorans NBRC 106553]